MNDKINGSNARYGTMEFTEQVRKKRATEYFPSSYSFLKEHKGFRPGEMHVFLASAGAGKSTLIRGLLSDTLISKMSLRVGLWLSEERVQSFWEEFSQSNEYRSNPFALDRLTVVSENDIVLGGHERSMELIFSDFLNNSDLDIIFIDNITTSRMYNNRTNKEQSKFVGKLKVACERINIPFVIVAHTNDESDMSNLHFPVLSSMRGDNSFINLVNYAYMMAAMHFRNKRYSLLKVMKCRSADMDCTHFFLEYAPKYRLVIRSHGVSNDEYENMIKEEKAERAKKAKGVGVNVPFGTSN